MKTFVWASTFIVGMIAAAAASAQSPAPPPCTSDEHRQFDFWVGDWTVVSKADGSPQGHNRIEKILGGCALNENWTGAGGSNGKSYSIYDRATKHWHQTWVDDSGRLLQLDGGFIDGAMVLEGEGVSADGTREISHRVSWTPLPEGVVRQHWVYSADGGKTWQDAFDGLYRRTGSEPKAAKPKPAESEPKGSLEEK